MAYDFVAASSQRILSNASFSGLGYPITLSCWLRPDLTGTLRIAFSVTHPTLGTALSLGQDASNYLIAEGNYGGTTGTSQSSSTLSTGTWYHVAGIFNGNASRTVYVDGIAGTTNTTAITTANYSRPTVGTRNRAGTFGAYFDGKVAECAVWTVALNDDEIVSLARGFRASLIRPLSLRYYAALAGNSNDVRDNVAATVTGATLDKLHPRRIA